MVKDDALPPPSLATARVEPMAGLWRRQGGGEGCPRWRRLNRRPSRLGLGDAGAEHFITKTTIWYHRRVVVFSNS
jgi:hypothetical protein